jgi:hypothetical protein
VPVRTPVTPVTRNILIESQVTGYDSRGSAYSDSASFEVQVRPYVSIDKKVEAAGKVSGANEMETDGYFRITLRLRNTAGFGTILDVRDELPSSMIPQDVERTQWKVPLDAGAAKEITYNAKPTESGSFTFGPAVAQWEDGGEIYTVDSEPITEIFRVRGSKVIVEKSIASGYLYDGEMTEIVVTATNAGTGKVSMILTDRVPEELSLMSGQVTWEGELEAGASQKISYVVKAEDIGTVRLPAAGADCTDEEGKHYTAVSDTPVVYIDNALSEEHSQASSSALSDQAYAQTGQIPDPGNAELTRTEAAGFMLSAFITLFSLLAIIPAIMYLFIRGVYK